MHFRSICYCFNMGGTDSFFRASHILSFYLLPIPLPLQSLPFQPGFFKAKTLLHLSQLPNTELHTSQSTKHACQWANGWMNTITLNGKRKLMIIWTANRFLFFFNWRHGQVYHHSDYSGACFVCAVYPCCVLFNR